MRRAGMHANLSDGAYHDLVSALHHQFRVPCRLFMVLLSMHGWTSQQISELLHYDPKTVRAWVHRHAAEGLPGMPDRPRSGRPRRGGPKLAARIRALLDTPKAWTTVRLWVALGRPALSLRTVYRRTREQASWRRPRLVPKGDANHDSICAAIRARGESMRAIALRLGNLLVGADRAFAHDADRACAGIVAPLIPAPTERERGVGVLHPERAPGSDPRRSARHVYGRGPATRHEALGKPVAGQRP